MAKIPAAAAKAVVQDLEGGEHVLSSLWAEQTVVLAFVRHFGWLFCREQAVQLHRELDHIRERGAELVLVGNGNARWGRAFRDELALTCPIYVDERREAYTALGMKRSMAAALNLSTARNAARALSAGFKQTAVRGDTWQLGGVLVVRPGGTVAYEYLSEEPGDHPPVADVLAALKPKRSR